MHPSSASHLEAAAHSRRSLVAAYIKSVKTLRRYDGPQLVEVIDDIDQHYIGMQMPDEQMLFVHAPLERIGAFRDGQCDLRSLLKCSGEDRWYMSDWPGPSPDRLLLHIHAGPLTNNALLPKEGFFLPPTNSAHAS